MTLRTPVIAIRGLSLHSSSWQPWTDPFRREGYDPSAGAAPAWQRQRNLGVAQ
jgi:hypothetical protein